MGNYFCDNSICLSNSERKERCGGINLHSDYPSRFRIQCPDFHLLSFIQGTHPPPPKKNRDKNSSRKDFRNSLYKLSPLFPLRKLGKSGQESMSELLVQSSLFGWLAFWVGLFPLNHVCENCI